MKKARSRLSLPNETIKTVGPSASSAILSSERNKLTSIDSKPSSRMKHLPTLLIGLFFVFLMLALIVFFSPNQLKNFILPNTYLPFLVCFLMGSFFLLSWFLLDGFIGMWWAVWLTCLIFLRFQQVIFGWPEIIFCTVGFTIGVTLYVWRKLIQH